MLVPHDEAKMTNETTGLCGRWYLEMTVGEWVSQSQAPGKSSRIIASGWGGEGHRTGAGQLARVGLWLIPVLVDLETLSWP